MADPQPTPSPYVAETLYETTLARAVEFPKGSGIMHSPRSNPHHMTGAALQAITTEIVDAVAGAKPV